MAFLRKTFGEYVLVMLTLLIGISASVVLAWLQDRSLQNRVRQDFEITARDRIEVISTTLSNTASLGRSVASFFRASENVTAHEFELYTTQLLADKPFIRAIEWIPSINGEKQRQSFESQMRKQDSGFAISQQNIDDMFVPLPAHASATYFPIHYITPLKGNRALLGLDVSTNPVRYEALVSALNTNRGSLSGKLNLVQGTSHQSAVAMMVPTYKERNATENGQPVTYEKLEGFASILLPIAGMIEESIRPLTPAGVNILIYDLNSADGRQKPMYIRASRLAPLSDEKVLADSQRDHVLQRIETIDVANRKWEIKVLPSPGYYKMGVNTEVWLLLLGGSLFTALLVVYMLQRIREREKIARQVVDRTQQLQKTKRQVELILRSTHEGILGVDNDGIITFSNPMATALLGYTKRELTGQQQHKLLHHSHADGSPYPYEECPIQRAIREGVSVNVADEVFWRKDGTAIAIEYAAAPIIDDSDIEGCVIIFRDVTDRRKHEQELQHMARYDQLTGLANRALFFELLRKAIQRTLRSDHRIAVIYMDLNGFKPVNDTLGHAAGDVLLKQFAERVQHTLREHDTLARVGGDEFVVLADNLAGRAECEMIIERIKDSLKETFVIEDTCFIIGASIGVALYPRDSKDMDTLISYADKAMYEAKHNKSLPYVFYEDLAPEEAS
jgi:diguanylate cyclase (GGDEF)-like protein/PAS domain S-box-containing protein